jgi:DNA-binding MarR family transcriptional regulator
MSDQLSEASRQAEQAPAGQPQPPTPTKAAQVLKLLARSRGATLADLTTATRWQPHTVRAHLTRLRKAGHTLERLERKTGPDAYHLVGKPSVTVAEGPHAGGEARDA